MPETQGSRGLSGVLDRIVRTKEQEVEALLASEGDLRAAAGGAPEPRDFAGALRRGGEVALMAEVKRRSPGAGDIRPGLDPADLARAYERAGAAAVSVLTDATYFGGSLRDLVTVRGAVGIPVFRKEFVIHEVQLLEARCAGADGVLLIARILRDRELRALLGSALGLGLCPLVEVHDARDAGRALEAGAEIVGINNRNLQTFETSLDVTLRLLSLLPDTVTVVSESGIRSPADVERLGSSGVDGVLVGETLLRAPEPGLAAAALVGRPRVERRGT